MYLVLFRIVGIPYHIQRWLLVFSQSFFGGGVVLIFWLFIVSYPLVLCKEKARRPPLSLDSENENVTVSSAYNKMSSRLFAGFDG